MNKNVMITGATGGLGKAFVVEFARRGYNLFLSDMHEEALETLSDSIKRCYEVDVNYKTLNFLKDESFEEYWEYVRDTKIKFNMLVNIAGVDYEGEFFEQDTKNILSIAKINMLSVLGMTRNIIDYIDLSDKFRVINVSSLASFYPMPFKATYSASKTFINSISTALNQELKQYNGSVTALCPAGMPTRDDCINSIQSQGFMGSITTHNTSYIVSKTIDNAIKGRKTYIPGFINNVLRVVGSVIPKNILAGLIYNRWAKTREVAKQTEEVLV